LLSSKAAVSSAALMKLSNWHFEDFHSGFVSPSSYAGKGSVKTTYSPDMMAQANAFSFYLNKRISSLGKTPDSYSEQGDTAFVTFDHFTGLAGDYYTTPVTEVPKLEADPNAQAPDTFAVVTYAHSQITRTGSPIKNVVIDLSCNGGGALGRFGLYFGLADGRRYPRCEEHGQRNPGRKFLSGGYQPRQEFRSERQDHGQTALLPHLAQQFLLWQLSPVDAEDSAKGHAHRPDVRWWWLHGEASQHCRWNPLPNLGQYVDGGRPQRFVCRYRSRDGTGLSAWGSFFLL
jgi:hypothetical protein